MGLNAAIAAVGIAKQTAKGAAATSGTTPSITGLPAFLHGVTGGSVVTAEVTQGPIDVTSGTREPTHTQRSAIATGIDPKTLAFVNSIGLWLLAALGTDTVTGTGPLYTHAYSIGADLPWVTLFGRYGGANYFAMPDAKVDKMSLSWKGNDPLEVAVTGLSASFVEPTGLTITTDDTYADYFIPNGGTFQLSLTDGTPVDAVMVGGTFDIDNALDAVVASGSILPRAINPKAFTPGAKLSVMPDDMTIIRKILTGSATIGTAISETVVYGSFLCKFLCGTAELTVKGQKVPFSVKFPDADPKGGTATLELESVPIKKDTSTPALEFILKNAVASY